MTLGTSRASRFWWSEWRTDARSARSTPSSCARSSFCEETFPNEGILSRTRIFSALPDRGAVRQSFGKACKIGNWEGGDQRGEACMGRSFVKIVSKLSLSCLTHVSKLSQSFLKIVSKFYQGCHIVICINFSSNVRIDNQCDLRKCFGGGILVKSWLL